MLSLLLVMIITGTIVATALTIYVLDFMEESTSVTFATLESGSDTYFYGTDKLVYCYNVFFSYGEHGVINNDWGTQCYINEEGEAVYFKMTSAEEM